MALIVRLLATIATTEIRMIDIHSHILPGIDDGSKSFDESLKILRGLSQQGITDVICTPHYIAETKQTSTKANNTKLLAELKQKAKEASIDINIYLGNEIYIDREISKLIRLKKISALNDSKYLLIELPMSGKFEQYEDIFLTLQQKGWNVILAHPERYHSFQNDYKLVTNLHKSGILFQCNLGSYIGQYGKKAQKLAKKIAKEKLIFCLGTDIHHERDYNEIAKAKRKLQKYYRESELNAILVENPKRII